MCVASDGSWNFLLLEEVLKGPFLEAVIIMVMMVDWFCEMFD